MLGRLDSVLDLPAAEGRYHRTCYPEFFREAHSHIPGRPKTSGKSSAFEKLCTHIDSSGECQYSLPELELLLHDFGSDNDSYSAKHLRRKLEERYEDKVTVTTVPGKASVFTFQEYSDNILYDRWYTDKCSNAEDE